MDGCPLPTDCYLGTVVAKTRSPRNHRVSCRGENNELQAELIAMKASLAEVSDTPFVRHSQKILPELANACRGRGFQYLKEPRRTTVQLSPMVHGLSESVAGVRVIGVTPDLRLMVKRRCAGRGDTGNSCIRLQQGLLYSRRAAERQNPTWNCASRRLSSCFSQVTRVNG